MIRVQIQITPRQNEQLEYLTMCMDTSRAALVRQAIDLLLRQQLSLPTAHRRARALAAVGAVQGSEIEPDDVAEYHDRYLAELD